MIDLVFLAIILVSALLGLMRGLVGILVSTAAWVLAGLAAFQFGADAALWLAADGQPTATQLFGGYALTFVAVLLAIGLMGALVRGMVRASDLSGVDRTFGFAVGVARGLVIGCILVLLLGFTPLPREASWRQSWLVPMLLPGAEWMRERLPDWSVAQIDFRNALPNGDNGVEGEQPSPMLEGAMQQVIDSALRRPVGSGKENASDAQPVNLDQAGDAMANTDPAGTGLAPPRGTDLPRPPSR